MNKDVFQVLEKVWDQGGGTLELPARKNVPIPEPLAPRFRLGSTEGALHLTVGILTSFDVTFDV